MWTSQPSLAVSVANTTQMLHTPQPLSTTLVYYDSTSELIQDGSYIEEFHLAISPRGASLHLQANLLLSNIHEPMDILRSWRRQWTFWTFWLRMLNRTSHDANFADALVSILKRKRISFLCNVKRISFVIITGIQPKIS